MNLNAFWKDLLKNILEDIFHVMLYATFINFLHIMQTNNINKK